MDILIIHQYFKTPEEGGAIRSYYIADYLSSIGHNVKVITAHNNSGYKVKKIKAFEVHYLPIYYSNHLSFRSRVHAFWLFVVHSSKILKKFKSDLNYVISTPLSTALIALYGKWKFGTSYCFEVGDLWPQAPIQLGVLRNPLLKWGAYQLERRVYNGARNIVALSPDIQKIIRGKVPSKQIDVVTNMSDPDYFYPAEKDEQLVTQYGLQGKFCIAYFGTIGLANHLEYLIEVARHIRQDNVVFLIMGSGAQSEKIRSLSVGLQNIRFIEPGDKRAVQRIISLCEAVYISFKKIPILGSGCPNKLFDGLAAGKLIIINFEGWVKELIERHDCGFYYDPEKPQNFMPKLNNYLKDADYLTKSQQRGLQLALQRFSVKVQTKNLNRIISG